MSGAVSIRPVQPQDRPFWFSLDRHLSEAGFEEKVRQRTGYVLLEDGVPAGVLRYNLFWDSIPFCNLLVISPRRQGRGRGKALLDYWENRMREAGHSLVMTSSRADEGGQHFFRAMGYRDAGGLLLDAPGWAQPMELLFAKAL